MTELAPLLTINLFIQILMERGVGILPEVVQFPFDILAPLPGEMKRQREVGGRFRWPLFRGIDLARVGL